MLVQSKETNLHLLCQIGYHLYTALQYTVLPSQKMQFIQSGWYKLGHTFFVEFKQSHFVCSLKFKNNALMIKWYSIHINKLSVIYPLFHLQAQIFFWVFGVWKIGHRVYIFHYASSVQSVEHTAHGFLWYTERQQRVYIVSTKTMVNPYATLNSDIIKWWGNNDHLYNLHESITYCIVLRVIVHDNPSRRTVCAFFNSFKP